MEVSTTATPATLFSLVPIYACAPSGENAIAAVASGIVPTSFLVAVSITEIEVLGLFSAPPELANRRWPLGLSARVPTLVPLIVAVSD